MQKYENASNRVSASVLYHIAKILDVPISFFFDDMADGQTLPVIQPDDLIARPESMELIHHYYAIPEAVRRQFYQLIKTMAKNSL